jgi:hypothetical protein
MCGISGSFGLNKLLELININNTRGTFSFSLMVFNTETKTVEAIYKGFDDFRSDVINSFIKLNRPEFYYISHSQAPTSTDIGLTKNVNRIHPASNNNHFLYHNGIIKTNCIKELQRSLNSNEEWDTKLLLDSINSDYTKLESINGSFACVEIKNTVNIFRNESSILYYDDDLNISSINHNSEMEELPPNTVFKLDFKSKIINPIHKFVSPDHGYVFL